MCLGPSRHLVRNLTNTNRHAKLQRPSTRKNIFCAFNQNSFNTHIPLRSTQTPLTGDDTPSQAAPTPAPGLTQQGRGALPAPGSPPPPSLLLQEHTQAQPAAEHTQTNPHRASKAARGAAQAATNSASAGAIWPHPALPGAALYGETTCT